MKGEVEVAYNCWASQYDGNKNNTRDMEAVVLRELLCEAPGERFLEIGCGTGKNTVWIADKYDQVTSVDFSEEMLAIAKKKVTQSNITFRRGDITSPWLFASDKYDVVGFSLVLEHIENLDFIFEQCVSCLNVGGFVYIGELHPFKQYAGTKARFQAVDGETRELSCFVHHTSEFVQLAFDHGLRLVKLREYFDGNDRSTIPRILGLLLQKI